MKLESKRWLILIASVIINLCIGSGYAWSVFAGPLNEYFTNTLMLVGVTAASVTLAFTISNLLGPVTMITGGRIQDLFGPRWVIFTGSFLFGGGAEPDFGDPAYLLGSIQVSAPAGLDGQAHVLTADFLPNGRTSVNPFGVVLHPETNINATTLGDSVDNGAATSGGWHANLHITATSSGDYEFRIEQSATGAFSGEETTLATFTLDGSAIGSEELSGSGSVAQHVRFVATKTAGSCTPVCVFARN